MADMPDNDDLTRMPPEGDAHAELVQRLRVLLYARPLLQLRRNEAHRQQGHLAHYDLLVIALKIFDLVVENTGLDEEMSGERLLPHLVPILKVMDEGAGVTPSSGRHREVVQAVLDWLLNERERRAPFQEDYLAVTSTEAVRRTLEFRLIDTQFQGEDVVLRLTDPGVNLYLSALDIDIESAQAATEAVLESQVRRGKLESAMGTAKAARAQSIQYQQKIEGILHQTTRDLRSVDWKRAVPDLLEEAYEHTALRRTTETNILTATNERLDRIEYGGADARRLTDIGALVQDCFERHVRLQGMVMSARGVFLDAQEAQEFKPRRSGVLPNLQNDVLIPLMRMPAVEADKVGVRMAQALHGPLVPRLFALGDYLEWAMQPRREVGVAASPVVSRELSDLSLDLLHFPDDIREEGDAWLLRQREPVLLSDLLPNLHADGRTDALREYVALRVLNLYAPETETLIPVIVERMDERFTACGFAGHDFVVHSFEQEDHA